MGIDRLKALWFMVSLSLVSGWSNAEVGLVSIIEPEKMAIAMPKAFKPIQGVLTNTHYIGTPDRPTIDGGIINSTDVLTVQDSEEIKRPQKLSRTPFVSIKESVPSVLDDKWATRERVRRFLTSASHEGKLSYVLKKTAEMKLPASVAVVPMVESNYETRAVSPKGAVGAWQLMPETAVDFGMKEKERFQFVKSTDTALRLLARLHHQFGNWALAFAAYNAGSSRVLAALHKNPKATSVDELDLPSETKTYVHRLMGINKTIQEMGSHV